MRDESIESLLGKLKQEALCLLESVQGLISPGSRQDLRWSDFLNLARLIYFAATNPDEAPRNGVEPRFLAQVAGVFQFANKNAWREYANRALNVVDEWLKFPPIPEWISRPAIECPVIEYPANFMVTNRIGCDEKGNPNPNWFVAISDGKGTAVGVRASFREMLIEIASPSGLKTPESRADELSKLRCFLRNRIGTDAAKALADAITHAFKNVPPIKIGPPLLYVEAAGA